MSPLPARGGDAPAMAAGPAWQDGRDVLLDCPLGDREMLCERAIRMTRRHQRQHCALARRQSGAEDEGDADDGQNADQHEVRVGAKTPPRAAE